jgi:hypothetical protein
VSALLDRASSSLVRHRNATRKPLRLSCAIQHNVSAGRSHSRSPLQTHSLQVNNRLVRAAKQAASVVPSRQLQPVSSASWICALQERPAGPPDLPPHQGLDRSPPDHRLRRPRRQSLDRAPDRLAHLTVHFQGGWISVPAGAVAQRQTLHIRTAPSLPCPPE